MLKYYNFSQMLQFIVVYLAYGCSYLLRMPYGVIKSDLLQRYNLSVKSLGYVDLAFLLPYSLVSLTLSGTVEFLGARLTFSLCLLISAIACLILPICWSFELFIVFTALIGVFQALCWPSSCAIISHNFDNSKSSSSVFGLFGTCCFIGGIGGKFLAVYLKSEYSLSHVFIIPSITVIISSVMVFVFIKNIPSLQQPMRQDDAEKNLLQESPITVGKPSLWATFMLPGVFEVSITMFFIKSIRYMFIFWLPFFLVKALHYTDTKAGYTSLAFDFGGIIGSFLFGHVSDTFMKGRDMYVCVFGIVGSTLSLILFWMFPSVSCTAHVAFLMWVGSMYGGSDILLSASVASKLGRRYRNEGGVTYVTGLVNGMGSLGTVIEGPLVACVSDIFGWDSVLLFIVMFSAIASLVAIKASSLTNFHTI